ncbi:Chorismate synthase [Fundidesulfovibrio magnetotacticus]|uniref:Chorismate synthase n=1 Tax=Fundidesulfovibrio magnetotacticus TaxID=2730080 RepID=A0A6V8LSB1_9BACT|nr:chorismate synthase [Fundidesulfovibrio magnetotacticus]GFK93860.1 Chorismate synthase [Fundidesulfovibrio magnetotacticus]
MNANTFGSLLRLTTFGESHGPAIGGVLDGCPAGLPLSEADLQQGLDRRRPGQGGLASTARDEPDRARILSGVFEGVTTGTPIAFVIENTDQRSRDYSAIKDIFRPGHADYTYQAKYGVRDYRGGGRASARETAARVAGGEVARLILARGGVKVYSYTTEMGDVPAQCMDPLNAHTRPFYAPDDYVVDIWTDRVELVRSEGDSIGGVVCVTATGMPAGLGEPVFDKLDARLAYALMGVGAVKGVEIGAGFSAARNYGSKNNDPITPRGFASNRAGGMLGGISSGQDIVVRAAVKPIPSVAKEQLTTTTSGEETTVRVGGRHDACAIPRINPVLEAMVCLTLADFWLLSGRRI